MLDKLRVDTSWLDRMGISETERSPLEIAGDDSRCIGLSDVASLWQGKNIYFNIDLFVINMHCFLNMDTIKNINNKIIHNKLIIYKIIYGFCIHGRLIATL